MLYCMHQWHFSEFIHHSMLCSANEHRLDDDSLRRNMSCCKKFERIDGNLEAEIIFSHRSRIVCVHSKLNWFWNCFLVESFTYVVCADVEHRIRFYLDCKQNRAQLILKQHEEPSSNSSIVRKVRSRCLCMYSLHSKRSHLISQSIESQQHRTWSCIINFVVVEVFAIRKWTSK